jgi:hypothetical protein
MSVGAMTIETLVFLKQRRKPTLLDEAKARVLHRARDLSLLLWCQDFSDIQVSWVQRQ